MGSFGVLGLGLFGVGIDKRWNFNGCGDFGGETFGGGNYIIGVGRSGSKGWGCGVCGGRAWVISLPKFFLEKYFHFWKLPLYFCINS